MIIQSGVATFFGRPQRPLDSLGNAKCALVGIPWDEGNAGRNGANSGPRVMRDVSSWFLSYDPQHDFDLWDHLPGVDVGDIDVVPPNAEATVNAISESIATIVKQGGLPISIGGNHAVTIGCSRGVAPSLGSMGYLSVDAHLDTAPDWAGERFSSGCPTYRAAEIPNVDPKNVCVFGVHGWLNPRSQVDAARELGIGWYGMDRIEEMGVDRAIAEAIDLCTNGVSGLYVTFDMDSIDACSFPGTGTPEPGGLTSREAIRVARALGRARPVGFDAVEIAPIYDLSGISARLACAVVMAFLSGWCEGQR